MEGMTLVSIGIKIVPYKYSHNRKGIREVALQSERVRQMIAEKTAQIHGLAQAMIGDEAIEWQGGRSRARGYVFRRRAANEARDGALNLALRQARSR